MSNQIRGKLLHYEVPPPPAVWDRIDASLDAGAASPFALRLEAYAPAPPAHAWEKISSSLSQPHKTGKYRKLIQFSVAAAALLFVVFLTSLLFTKKLESEVAATPASISSSAPQNIAIPDTESEVVASNPVTKRTRSRQINSSEVFSAASLLPRTAERAPAFDFAEDKYMIYTDADGSAIRLPKKLFETFACSQESAVCRQRIRQLQEKISATSFSADFAGILELLNQLQETP